MKKVNVIRVAFDEIDKVVNDVRKQRIALDEKLEIGRSSWRERVWLKV